MLREQTDPVFCIFFDVKMFRSKNLSMIFLADKYFGRIFLDRKFSKKNLRKSDFLDVSQLFIFFVDFFRKKLIPYALKVPSLNSKMFSFFQDFVIFKILFSEMKK